MKKILKFLLFLSVPVFFFCTSLLNGLALAENLSDADLANLQAELQAGKTYTGPAEIQLTGADLEKIDDFQAENNLTPIAIDRIIDDETAVVSAKDLLDLLVSMNMVTPEKAALAKQALNI